MNHCEPTPLPPLAAARVGPTDEADDLHVPMGEGEPGSLQEQVHLRQLLRNAGRKLRRQSGILHLLYQVTRIANEASDLEQALQASIDVICQLMGWSVGHVYRLDGQSDEMVPSTAWWVRDRERFIPFQEVTTRTRFTRGEGLVGRAWASTLPHWVEDVTRDPGFLRSRVGRDLGIHGALVVPVSAHERVVAVLEFFSEQAEEVNEQLLHAMEQVGVQLGHVFERQQAAAEQSAVEQARARLANILETTSDIVGTASVDGRLLFINRSGREALGVPPNGDLAGMTIADFHPPWAIRKVFEEGFPAALQGQVWHGETALLGRGGKEIPVSQVVLAHFDATGRLECLSTVARDISERKQSEATLLDQSVELHLANAQLERAARLKDEFLANMSHELRTPLNAILGLSEALQEGVFGTVTAEQEASLGTIRDSGGHLLALINDILDLSKAEAGMLQLDLEPVNLVDVVQASLQFVRQAARLRRITLSTRFPQAPPPVMGDSRRLKQVTVNLLGNAVKFTPEGGRVSVELDADDDRRAVRLLVRDTGIGIAEGDLDRLFQPFVQLHSGLARRYEGTGLGLSLVARMIELHGGSVSAESKLGEGSCFTVLLPAHARDEGLSDPSEAAPSVDVGPAPAVEAPLPRQEGLPPKAPQELAGLRVLLVEDNDLNVLTVQHYLEKKGCLVAVARDGVEGVRMAREATPQVILMDIQMPRMDGLEATRTIRQDRDLAGLPIIALTALATEEDRARCFDAGADRCLSKPAALSVLVTTMLEVLPRPSLPER